jgi:dTDP-4-amino-4,6-dideoxygalactose transaminase
MEEKIERIAFYEKSTIPEAVIEKIRLAAEEGMGEPAEALERLAAEATGAPYALATSSSSTALHLAMCALDLKRGDKVVCSVNAYLDVPEAVRHFDAEPIFVDCDPFSYNIDPNKLEEVLKANRSKKLRAVIVNHMAGLPAEMERIHALAREYEVEVIEDATDAPAARYRGQPVGNLEGTLMTVCGLGNKFDNRFDAGLLLTAHSDCYERGALLRNHARIPGSKTVEYLYDVVDIGCQFRLNDFAALYAEAIFARREADRERRMEIAGIYFRELEGLDHIRLPLRHEDHSYFYYIIEVDKNRDAFARALAERGIEVALHYVPLHTTRYYKNKYDLKLFDFPWAMGAYQRVISLPNRPGMSDEEVLRVCEAVREIDAAHV